MLDIFGGKIDPSQYTFEAAMYFLDITLTASQLLTNQTIQLKAGEDFFFGLRRMSTQTGAFRIQIYDTTSRRYVYNGTVTAATTDRARYETLFGTASRPGVMPIGQIFIGAIIMDVEDISAAPNTLHIAFEGLAAFHR